LPKHLVFVEAKAQKQLKKLPKDDQERIIIVLNALEEEGLSARIHIKILRGYQRHYRIRAGDYKILFELSAAKKIVVYSIFQHENASE